MDLLTAQECQDLIDSITEWESKHIFKQKGGELKFKQAKVTVWGNQHRNVYHELVMKYDVGDFCTVHTDNAWRKIRQNYISYAVWITPLNSDYTGGELYFNGERITQNVGVPIRYLRTIPHEVKPITSGTRYSLVSWAFIEDK